MGDIITPTLTSDTHLIRPSDTSEAYANRHKLVPFRQWINLTHEDSYIHGPFDFAVVRGRKTRDRIDQRDWDVLSKHTSMFQNEIPRFDLPTYSIHVDRGVHVTHRDDSTVAQLHSAVISDNVGDRRRYLWQKASDSDSSPAPRMV
jgi:hypothetical protein